MACRWQWIPYVASGLPLSMEIERAQRACPDTNIFVLGNHGLVIAAEDTETVEALLTEVTARLAIPPRMSHPADYAVLMDMCDSSPWELPDDDALHALGTDPIARSILAGGMLYPCQAIFSWSSHGQPPFLIVEGSGLLVNKTLPPPNLPCSPVWCRWSNASAHRPPYVT